MTLSRRNLLQTAGLGLSAAAIGSIGLPGRSQAWAEGMPDWQIGYANAPAEGFSPSAMRQISGRLPTGFEGSFYRNGPGWFRHGDSTLGHWFDGDGMIQRIHFADGTATHRGAFVQTQKHRAEQSAAKFLAPGFGSAGDPSFPVMSPDDVNAANTSVLVAGGELLALWEAGSAFVIDPETLDTLGPKTWRSDLEAMPFLAHPKVEPNGAVWNLAVSGPHVGVYQIAPGGTLSDFHMLNIGKAAYIHDWAMTDRHLIILVQPWIMTRNIPPFVNSLEWQPDEGLQMLIVDKADPTQQRWAEAPAKAFFHTGAAWEDQSGHIHIDVCLYDQPVLGPGGATNLMEGRYEIGVDDLHAQLSRITIPPSGAAQIHTTDIDGEFPTVHPQFHGLGRRYTTCVGGDVPGRPGPRRVSVMDWQSGTASHFDYGVDRIAEEHLVVPKPGGTTDGAAWLVGTVLNTKTQVSEVHVFDMVHVADGPMASFAADYAWPLGFHGTFHSA